MIRRLTPRWRIRATIAAIGLPPLIHLVSLDRIARWISLRPMPAVADHSVDDPAISQWVDRVLHHLPPPWRHTCLRRALVLHYLVHRAGRPAELRIGVRRDDQNALAAHAWLVRDGAPYLEPSINHVETFQVLTAFPSVGGQTR
jgi:Transglutaminase-like superfamily